MEAPLRHSRSPIIAQSVEPPAATSEKYIHTFTIIIIPFNLLPHIGSTRPALAEHRAHRGLVTQAAVMLRIF